MYADDTNLTFTALRFPELHRFPIPPKSVADSKQAYFKIGILYAC